MLRVLLWAKETEWEVRVQEILENILSNIDNV